MVRLGIYFTENAKIMYGWAFISLKQLKIVRAGGFISMKMLK